jgi:clan AA aspartic protease (TIGR02281 family)
LPKALRDWAEAVERALSQVRAWVEHPFHVVKNLFRHDKLRYRGLLLDEQGYLSPAYSADRLGNITEMGYKQLTRPLDTLLDRMLSTEPPTAAPRVQPDQHGRMIEVPTIATKDDAIFVTGSINSRPVTFEVDSGASSINIRDLIAKKLNLGAPVALRQVSFADGRTPVYPVFQIRLLRIGDAELHDVEALVGGNGDSILLGRSALNKFARWTVDPHRGMLLLFQ